MTIHTHLVRRRLAALLLVGSSALAIGCGGKSKNAETTYTVPSRPTPTKPTVPRKPADQPQTATITPDRGGSEAVPSFAPIRFDFDSSDLSPAARDELDEVATWMAKTTGRVTIEGHADERGTTEYNLALGQQRAEVIARHLVRLGVAEQRLKTITWGEEHPAVEGSDESAWAQNRRGQLNPDR